MKTEHAGAKNGGGHWGSREEAKDKSRSKRRVEDKVVCDTLHEERRAISEAREDLLNYCDKECPPPVRPARKKDTKKWCKGKEGRVHTGVCENKGIRMGGRRWYKLHCSTCGKTLDHYTPISLKLTNGKTYDIDTSKPDWVVEEREDKA